MERTPEEIEKRATQADTWRKRSKSFWTDEIHGYIDNKTFLPIPKTAAKMSLLKKLEQYFRDADVDGNGYEPQRWRLLSAMILPFTQCSYSKYPESRRYPSYRIVSITIYLLNSVGTMFALAFRNGPSWPAETR